MYNTSDAGFEHFAEAIGEIGAASVVLDLGTPEPFRKELARFRGALKGLYVGVDAHISPRTGTNPPMVRADLHFLPIGDRRAEAVVLKDVLEHVSVPTTVVGEVYRVLRKGGRVVCVTPWAHPYHGNAGPYGKDYWRFSVDALRELFSCFKRVNVSRLGGPLSVLRNHLPSRAGQLLNLPPLRQMAGAIDRRLPIRNLCSGFILTAVK